MNTLEGNKLTGAQKEELMDQVKQQVAVLLAQELLQVSLINKQHENCAHYFNYKQNMSYL